MLAHEGHCYVRKSKHSKTNWKCHISTCPGEAKTEANIVINVTAHNHLCIYDKIAAEILKEKVIEWGSQNCEVKSAKHLNAIYESLPATVTNYFPPKKNILSSIIAKQKRRGLIDGEPGQRHFILSFPEINDRNISRILNQIFMNLQNYYYRNRIILDQNLSSKFPNPQQQQQQQHNQGQTSESFINATVPSSGTSNEDMPTCSTFTNNSNNMDISQASSSSTTTTTTTANNNAVFCNNSNFLDQYLFSENEISEFRAFINNNSMPRLESNETFLSATAAATENDNESPPVLEMETMQFVDFDFDYDISNNQDLSLQNESNTTDINAECIQISAASIPNTPKKLRLEKTIACLHQKQDISLKLVENIDDEIFTTSTNSQNFDDNNQLQAENIQNLNHNSFCSDSTLDRDVQSTSNQFNDITSSTTNQENSYITDFDTDNSNNDNLMPTTEDQIWEDKILARILTNPDKENGQKELDEYTEKIISDLKNASKMVQEKMAQLNHHFHS
uniref:FLYWCH-type domain-containing protein n=1 Tax=Panagrolaimus superbus TaxID=310955 RepID=A0A914YWZ6_9BILA